MFNHISLGVAEVDRARKFYDAALRPLGYGRLYDGADGAGYGAVEAAFYIQAAKRPVPADLESGFHICFDAPSRDAVDAFYRAALAAGGRDNGKPGLRETYGPSYYAAFVIDPDGYRLEAYHGRGA